MKHVYSYTYYEALFTTTTTTTTNDNNNNNDLDIFKYNNNDWCKCIIPARHA